ncbi:MAG: hypothetical protein ABIO71_06655, partial [Caldimonas sp.]
VVLPASQAVTVRVRAEILRTGSANGDRDFKVLDNTNGNAVYVLDSAAFTPAVDTTQNLRAASGWTAGAGYTAPRAAGPFAILDVVYDAQAKVQTVAPTATLPPLRLFWSVNNRPVNPQSLATGAIGTSFFTRDASGAALYILGAANTDTDEYDTHVVAHEFGHYLQSVVSRDDSIGGGHGSNDKLDMRVAFSEGWGNAWSGIALGGPLYVDSFGTNQLQSFSIDVSASPSAGNRGWYSEASSQYLIWTTNQTYGFLPIYTALATMRTSPAFSSLYSFADAVKAATPANAAAITALWAGQNIVANDAFGTGETNNGGNPLNLPVYRPGPVTLGMAVNLCPHAEADTRDDGNKLGQTVFVRFAFSGVRTITLTKTSPAGAGTTDPDFELVKSDGTTAFGLSSVDDVETTSVTLPTGTHSLALSDFKLVRPNTSCFDFKVN